MTKEEINVLPVDAAAAIEFVSGEIASWEGVRVQEFRKGRVEFWLNSRCLGYLPDPHDETATASLNLELSEEILDDQIASGATRLESGEPNQGNRIRTTPPGGYLFPWGRSRKSFLRSGCSGINTSKSLIVSERNKVISPTHSEV